MNKWNYVLVKPVFDQCMKIYDSDLCTDDKLDALIETYNESEIDLDWGTNVYCSNIENVLKIVSTFKEHMEKLEKIK